MCTVHCAEWRVDTNSGRREMDWTLDTLAIKLRDEQMIMIMVVMIMVMITVMVVVMVMKMCDGDGDGDGGDGDGGDEDVAECFK